MDDETTLVLSQQSCEKFADRGFLYVYDRTRVGYDVVPMSVQLLFGYGQLHVVHYFFNTLSSTHLNFSSYFRPVSLWPSSPAPIRLGPNRSRPNDMYPASVTLQQHVKIEFFPVHLLRYFCDTMTERKKKKILMLFSDRKLVKSL